MSSQFILGSLCLTTLIEKANEGHSAFSKSTKDGKIYVNYAEWVNDELNEFGQHSSILLSSHKDKKDSEGKIYIGNGKKYDSSQPLSSKDKISANFGNVPVREKKTEEPKDDLPF